MWQDAAAINQRSVVALIRKVQTKRGRTTWQHAGSAFQLASSKNPTFMTCAHVLVNGNGKQRGEFGLISGFHGDGNVKVAGIRIESFSLDIDAAIFISGTEASCTPVHGILDTILPTGTPVASLGFPAQPQPRSYEGGKGELDIHLRFAAGYISASDSLARLQDTPYTKLDHHQYELNMFCYPGLNGGPIFNLDGLVIGMVRGAALMKQGEKSSGVIGYSFANRGDDLLKFAESSGLKALPVKG